MDRHKQSRNGTSERVQRGGWRRRQRIVILDAVCDGGKHTTPGEIYARVRAVDTSVERSTLYRTLNLFIELGLVVSAQPGDDETYYEIAASHPHHHLVCRRCGVEQEVSDDVMQGLAHQMRKDHGFQIEASHLVFSGLCAACLTFQG